jgi:hypothetical protein
MSETPLKGPAAENPYAPPLATNPEHEARGRSLTPVVIGVAIGGGLVYITLMPIGNLFLWVLFAQGVPTDQLYVRLCESPFYLGLAHLLGFCALTPGGYWAIRLDSERKLASAFWAGLAYAVFCLSTFMVPYSQPFPLWSNVLSLIIPIPAYLLGGAWALRKRHIS